PAPGQTVSVKYATSNATATAGSDYTAVMLTPATFLAGETTKTVTVALTPDSTLEPNETLNLTLSTPVGLVLADTVGVGTIVNDDEPIHMSVDDPSAPEGTDTASSLTFTVSLDAAPVSGQTVSVQVFTSSGTAEAGVDYTSIPLTTITFATGQMSRTVSVALSRDSTVEPDE